MVTLQILVLSFLVRIRVSQLKGASFKRGRCFFIQKKKSILGYGVMVTLQILVLSFLVRIRVSQLSKGTFLIRVKCFFLCAFLYERKSKSPMVLCIVGDLNKNPPCLGGVGGFPVCEDFYLFSASIALIFCLMSSSSSLSFCTLRFISSTRLLPFLLAALRKPRLFS